MQLTVVKNAKNNLFFGIVNKAVMILCPFITRTFIRYLLGVQYLGLDSLFASLLSVLSLSELGFSSAIVYNMYKPVAENDVKTVNALLNFYKRVYRFIGVVILLVGLCLIPFLPRLIKGSYPEDVRLSWLYLIYLFNTVISYFMFAYMTSLVIVHQRSDISSIINSVVQILLTSVQITVLILSKNYYLFLFILPISTILNNIWIAAVVKREFPQYRCEGELEKEKIADIKKLVIGTCIQKITGVTRNSLDSICISAFLGLSLTAIYGNYYYISSGVTSLLSVVFTAFIGGIGNHVATRSIDENYEELKKLDFVYLWLSGWCTNCLLCLYQHFMQIWMGKDMMLPMTSVCLFCIYFFVLKLGDMRSMYAEANGLYWEQRFRAIGEAAANVALNIILGKILGVNGIILATIISLIIFNYIWGAHITFDRYFGRSKIAGYYSYQRKHLFVVSITCICTYAVCGFVKSDSLIVVLIYRLVICLIMPNMIYLIVFHNTGEFAYLKTITKGI